MVKKSTVNLTSKEIEYQLKGDWEIDRKKYDWEDKPNGGFYGGARINHSFTGEEISVNPEYVKNINYSRINFDPNLMDLDSYPESFYSVGVSMNIKADYKGVRAFTIEHSQIEEYYPVHTTYKGKSENGEHIVEFVVKIETTLNNPLKYSNVTVGYSLHPDEKERRMREKERKPEFHFEYICMLKNTEVSSPLIVVYPPLNIQVETNEIGKDRIEFDSVREAEKWVANWYNEKSNTLGEVSEELF